MLCYSVILTALWKINLAIFCLFLYAWRRSTTWSVRRWRTWIQATRPRSGRRRYSPRWTRTTTAYCPRRSSSRAVWATSSSVKCWLPTRAPNDPHTVHVHMPTNVTSPNLISVDLVSRELVANSVQFGSEIWRRGAFLQSTTVTGASDDVGSLGRK